MLALRRLVFLGILVVLVAAPPLLAQGLPLTMSKSFNPSTVSVGGTSTTVMTVTITNPNGFSVSGISFSDTYPAGLVPDVVGAYTCSPGSALFTGSGWAFNNVTLGVTVVGGLVLLSGVLILVGAVSMTKFRRVYEAAILKTLGASSRLIVTMLLLEYGVLGAIAGTVGSLGAIVLSWAVARYALDLPWEPAPSVTLTGVVATALLVARLRRDGREAHACGYGRARGAHAKAGRVASALRELAASTGARRVDVITHGEAGVILRSAARDHGCLDVLGNVVSLGAPHRGAALASFFGLRSLAHLRPGSRYLTSLADSDPVPEAVNFTAIASSFDAAVFPPELAYYAGAMNVTLDWVGHHALLTSERIYRLAKENIDIEPKAAGKA